MASGYGILMFSESRSNQILTISVQHRLMKQEDYAINPGSESYSELI
jgi:hypothetical protein